MDKSEVMQAVLIWVLGMCYKHNQETGTFIVFKTFYDEIQPVSNSDGKQCAIWVRDCQEKVWQYINGRQIMLDAACSDFQCTIAIKADHIFREYLK